MPADGRKSCEDFERLLTAIRCEDVEFGGFDHKLAGRDAAGELPVDNEEAGSDHGSIKHEVFATGHGVRPATDAVCVIS